MGHTFSSQDLVRLRVGIVDCFDLSEIQTLCFDLNVSFQSLPGGDVVEGKSRELISYLRRRSRLQELVEICKISRPAYDWSWSDKNIIPNEYSTVGLPTPFIGRKEIKVLEQLLLGLSSETISSNLTMPLIKVKSLSSRIYSLFNVASQRELINLLAEQYSLTIDTRKFNKTNGRVWKIPYDEIATVGELLDEIYFGLDGAVPPFTFGRTWKIRDVNSSFVLHLTTRGEVNSRGTYERDDRELRSVGIYPQMLIEVIAPY